MLVWSESRLGSGWGERKMRVGAVLWCGLGVGEYFDLRCVEDNGRERFAMVHSETVLTLLIERTTSFVLKFPRWPQPG